MAVAILRLPLFCISFGSPVDTRYGLVHGDEKHWLCYDAKEHGRYLAQVGITRHGRMDNTIQIRVETIDGSATSEADFMPINQILTFQPNELEKEVEVEIINDDQWEPDEEFFLKLSLLPLDEYPHSHDGLVLGKLSIMEITILNDD
ncbi:unnamed protein product, partial [Notodromas monacha]